MKSLVLHIDERILDDLELSIRNKRLEGKFGGVVDMVALALIETTKANQPERTLRYRKSSPVINAIGK